MDDVFQYLDPQTQQLMIQAGLAPQKMALAGQDYRRGTDMADTPSPQGMTVGPMKAYVAASPMEHLASAIRQGRGEVGIRDARQAQAAALNQLGQGRGAYLSAAVRQAQNENRQPELPGPVAAPQPIGEDNTIPYYLRRPGY